MLLGQAMASGLTIDIPFIIKSLSQNIFSNNKDYLSFDFNIGLLNTPLVEKYMFNWWDHSDVRKVTL